MTGRVHADGGLDRRVEEHVMAYALARLLLVKAIPNGKEAVVRYLDVLEVSRATFGTALDDLARNGWQPPGRAQEGIRTYPRRDGEPTMKVCRGPLCIGPNGEGRRLPIEWFAPQSKGTRPDGSKKQGRNAYHHDCRLAFQRVRWLSRQVQDDLGVDVAVGTGLVCAECRQPIATDGEVHMLQVPVHKACLRAALDTLATIEGEP